MSYETSVAENRYGQELGYTCPHCQQPLRVNDSILGEVIDCPNCDTPIRVEVPSAEPANIESFPQGVASVDRPEREEDTLKSVHPAMLRTHPLAYLGFCLLIGLGIWGVIGAVAGDAIFGDTFQLILGILLILAGAGLLGGWWVKTRWTTLIVTTKRTILHKGIVSRNTTEVQHDDVRNLQVDQNIWERMVGVGDLAVSSSGQDDLEIHVVDIPNPEEIAELIRDLQ